MSDDYRLKYNYDFEISKPREFSSNDLGGMIRTPHSKDMLQLPNDSSSRASAEAMKALQEKIKILENELIISKDYIADLETKYSNDREKWQTRLIDEIQMTKERENFLQVKVDEMEEEIKKLLTRLNNAEEQIKIKDIQCKFSENEVKRNSEQFAVEYENMASQLEYFQKALNNKNSTEKKGQKSLEIALRDKELAKEELKQQIRINSGLQAEVNYMRENSDFQRNSLQKNHETIENELTQQNAEFSQKIKEYEIKNKSLRDINHNQSQQILHLKKEIAELNKLNELHTSTKVELVKSKSFRKKLPPSTPVSSKNNKRSISPSVRSNKRSISPTMKSNNDTIKMNKNGLENDEGLKKHISICEKEIDKLSNSYRDLLGMSSQGSGDLSSLRREMVKLANDIERKNEELYTYKKKQQEFLREKLIN